MEVTVISDLLGRYQALLPQGRVLKQVVEESLRACGAVEYWDKKVDKVIPSYITFHWTWEVNIGLENLEKFLEALKPSIEI
jgi:hypothetical protein